MKHEKKEQQFRYSIILVAVALMLMNLPSVSSIVRGGQIIDASNNTVDLYYTTISDSFTDGMGGNPQAKIRIIGDNAVDVGNRNVAGVYAVNTSSTNPIYSVITADSGGTSAVAPTGTAFACGAMWCADTLMDLNFQTNTAGTGDGAAFFPGSIFVLVSTDDSITFGAGDEIAPIASGVSGISSTSTRYTVSGINGSLRGRYQAGLSGYNPATGNINFNVISASREETAGGYATITLRQNNPFVVTGICNDIQGAVCDSTNKVNLSTGVVSMYTGVVAPPDTITTTKYTLINGLGASFCIGPDVGVISVNANPGSGYPGTVFNISAIIRNDGNVDVTTDFNVSFYDTVSGLIGINTITGGLNVGSSANVWVLYNTAGLLSGTKNINIYSNHTDVGIADCGASVNQRSTSILLNKAYMLNFYINGVKTTTFNSPGRMYNITAVLNDSDGNFINNATIRITEENGLSLFAPMQIFNETPSTRNGVKPITTAEVRTNMAGNATFVLAPSGNPLYSPAYAASNVEHYHGNYTIYAKAFSPSGGEYLLIEMPSFNVLPRINFNFSNSTIQYPNASQLASEQYNRQNNFVQQVYDFIDQAFASAFRRMDLI